MGTAAAMPDGTASGHMTVRILVALYTIASASGLIVGTNLGLLLTPFLPDWVAHAIMAALVTTLCYFMLAGVKRRAMALLLAVIFLWCSYFAILGPSAAIVGGAHWRDMVLIGALLLIYADTAHEGQNDIVALFRIMREPKALTETLRTAPEPPDAEEMTLRRKSQTLFHDDLEEFGPR